ncbi:MAG: hypothetical protein HQM09_22875, partial [Candidatus Riflebacteria bacterium]|nr:hypothetical protein [Candidatus Riflebacteria bacterium]
SRTIALLSTTGNLTGNVTGIAAGYPLHLWLQRDNGTGFTDVTSVTLNSNGSYMFNLIATGPIRLAVRKSYTLSAADAASFNIAEGNNIAKNIAVTQSYPTITGVASAGNSLIISGTGFDISAQASIWKQSVGTITIPIAAVTATTFTGNVNPPIIQPGLYNVSIRNNR